MFFALTISVTHTSCGPDDSPPVTPRDTTDDSNGFKKEYIIVDGVRYDADQIKKRVLQGNLRDTTLIISFNNESYPFIMIEHAKVSDGDGMLAHEYTPSRYTHTSERFGYEVVLWFAEGPGPAYCQNISVYEPSTPHEKYTLKKVNGKYVSEFGKAQLKCGEGGGARSTVEGYLIWED